jgi:hypothetical protein
MTELLNRSQSLSGSPPEVLRMNTQLPNTAHFRAHPLKE